MNQEARVTLERHFLGETIEERKRKFYLILKIMNECGEIEFLHALSSICSERYHEEDLLMDESKKKQWMIMSKLSNHLKNKLIEHGAM